MAENKTITLVTGANGGIGFELANQLLADASQHVLLGSRSLDKGRTALSELQAKNLPGSVELLQIDVDNEDSIAAAAKTVQGKYGRLDALVNNAAVALPSGNLSTQMTTCFRTNAIGPALTVELFTPLLKNSKTTARIVNVTSGAGSITRRLDPSAGFNKLREVQYRASKSALNMVTACQAVDLGPDGVKVFAYCPGFTVSNLGGFNTAENGAKPTSEGAKPIVDILNGKRDAEHGGFLHEKGQYAW